MATTEQLYMIADTLDIDVKFDHLNKNYIGLLGMADASRGLITLDFSLRDHPREHKCVLAEEIGHILHPPRPGHVAYHCRGYYDYDSIEQSMLRITVAQDERDALDWATGVLMPDVEFWRVIKEGTVTLHQLIDHFEVTGWFARIKIGYIRRKARDQGQRVRWRDVVRRE